MSKLISFEKSIMHKKPSYNEIAFDALFSQEDKIKLPDREAKLLRRSQKLTMFDDPAFLDLEQQSKQIIIQQIHNNAVQTLIQNSTDKTHSVEQATTQAPDPPDEPMLQSQRRTPRVSNFPGVTVDATTQTKPPPDDNPNEIFINGSILIANT